MTKTKKSVLIVEDNESLQKILVEKITSAGFSVSATGDAQQAIHLIQMNKPNLLLLDIMLPGGMNGFDILEQIKANENSKDIHVIVLTNLETEAQTAYDIGAEDYIVKANISLDEVVSKVKNILS